MSWRRLFICVPLLLSLTALTPAWAQLSVPTFGTRGDVPQEVLDTFMLALRRELVEATGLSVTIGELITPGIAASLDRELTLTIAELDSADYALSGEIRRAQPGALGAESAPFVVSVLAAGGDARRSSDLITVSLNRDDLDEAVRELAAAVARFTSPQQGLVAGTAGLFIATQPAEAQVSINGVGSGPATELEVLMLEPGEYIVEVRQDGYLPAQRRVELTSGFTETLSVSLDPIAGGSLQIFTTPKANVRLDGREVGETPLTVQALPGSHVVELWRPGFATLSVETLVRDYRVSSLSEVLRPNANISLYWDAAPEDLVFVNGQLQLRPYLTNATPDLYRFEVRRRGQVRSFIVDLPAGVHHLNLQTEALTPHPD